MNERFKASNGVEVWRDKKDSLMTNNWVSSDSVGAEDAEGLREFFQHERDQELARWRWPANRDYVVYHARNVNGDHKVMRESDGHGMLWGRDMEPAPHSSDGLESAARAYFDAHPERKPWEHANNEDIWALTIGPNEKIYQFDSTNRFFDQVGSGFTKGISANSRGITAGRRIWPESD